MKDITNNTQAIDNTPEAPDLSTLTEDRLTTLINEGNCKVKNLAESLNVKPIQIREHIYRVFGSRVEFRRGRNGGVKFINS